MTSPRPTLRLHGAFEVENFGDILLARIFADWVRESGWEPMIVDAPDYLRRELALADDMPGNVRGLLLFGGGYLGEPKRSLAGRWRWGLNLMQRHLSVLEWARTRNIPYAVIGAGFGPISNLLARWRTRSLLAKAQTVMLRDTESGDWARQYGVKVEGISADAALTLADLALRPAAVAEADRMRSLANGKPIVAVQFDKPETTDGSWLLLHTTLAESLRDAGFFVFGLSDQRNTAVAQKHRRAAEQFLGRIGQHRFEPYDSIDGLIGRLSSADLVITNKLHLGIVGSALGRSVLSLPTHQKTERFYRQLGRSEICVPKSQWSPKTLRAAFEKSRETMNNVPQLPVAALNAARANRVEVAEFLKKISVR